ncbi:fructosamine kinase family protein [Erwinia sp. HR93]|uniref:fructosamine kinase family protein n=1 Tax=Erwinia sp. HR93 TaxID=3094840 RepID=UPI002ADEC6C1|nr:fructosamine kinase family protein [Erwinia sp. HR93]MEA1064900.1 fructosamine kinase family protein [Erwinia sp. HR93]
MWQTIHNLLCEQFGDGQITQRVALPGGEIHAAWKITFAGRPIFIKSDDREMLSCFTEEADQLALLARSASVCVPGVLGTGSARDASFLLLDYFPPRPLDAPNAFLFGQQLAQLHQWSEQPQFGLDFDNHIATVPQPNGWQRRWAAFFAEQRIGWQLELAAEKGLTYGDIDAIVEEIQQRLSGHQPQPSLLHGDLWSGNCALGPKGPFIFDPACYWGDRECDLAMLPLHEALSSQIYNGYQTVSPLPAGYLSRQSIYRLYTLLNRATLFGGDHLLIAQQTLDKVLST